MINLFKINFLIIKNLYTYNKYTPKFELFFILIFLKNFVEREREGWCLLETTFLLLRSLG